MFKKYKDYSNTWVIDSRKPGPILAIFAGIHGNEIAGLKAMDKLLKSFEKKQFQINNGKLILAYGNEEAIKINQKELNYNMNRLFQAKYLNSSSDEYEIRRVKQLAKILDNTDYLLDIHSVSSKSEPFLFAENTSEELDIAKSLGLEKIISGWGEINEGTIIGGDVDSYMHSLGKIAFTVECGNHNDSGAEDIAYNTIMNYLAYLSMIDKKTQPKSSKLIKMEKIFITNTGKFRFVEGIHNFKQIKKGDIIGYDGENEIKAYEDFIILLPNYESIQVGEEVFYYGKHL